MTGFNLNLVATAGIVLQFLLEHFIEKKSWKRLAGFCIMLVASAGIWGSYYQQQKDSESMTNNLAAIKSQNDTLLIQVGNRDAAIQQIRAENDSLKRKVASLSAVSPKLDASGRIQLSPFVTLSSEFDTGINNARTLFNAGKFDEAFKVAEDLSRKNSSFGLAYFIMGTIQVQKTDYSRGEQNLHRSIKLGLTKDDEARAYHNLAIASLRQRKYDAAASFLEKCLSANPNMNESRQLLDQLRRR